MTMDTTETLPRTDTSARKPHSLIASDRVEGTAVRRSDGKKVGTIQRLMIDKITTVPKARLGKRIGKLNDEDVVRLNRALTVFLGLAR